MTRGTRIVPALVAALALAGCGGTSTPKDTGPSAAELARTLVVAGDLGPGWTVLTPPEGYGAVGVVTDKNRGMIPGLQFCGQATSASQTAAKKLAWKAFTQMNFTTGDQRHLVFVQEFLRSDAPTSIKKTYDLLAAGHQACAGQSTTYPDGEVGTSSAYQAPTVGAAQVGSRELVSEPGGRPATWDIRTVLAREGSVLLGVTVVEIRTPAQPRTLDEKEIRNIVTVIGDKAF